MKEVHATLRVVNSFGYISHVCFTYVGDGKLKFVIWVCSGVSSMLLKRSIFGYSVYLSLS